MTLFRRERRAKERYRPLATVVFTVRSGKDVSSTGMSVVTPRLAPDGIHIMYDTLMTFRNRIDATIFPEGKPPVRVQGTVAWFRAADAPAGFYIFGMQFDQEAPALEELLLAGRNPPG